MQGKMVFPHFASKEMLADGEKRRTIKNDFIIVPALMELAGFGNI